MARIPRILITGDPNVYHVIFRTALEWREGFILPSYQRQLFSCNTI